MNLFSGTNPIALAFAAGMLVFGLWEGLGGLAGTDAEGKVTDVGDTCVARIRRSAISSTSSGRTVTATYLIDDQPQTTSWCDRSPPSVNTAVTLCVTPLGLNAWDGRCNSYPTTGGLWVLGGLVSLAYGMMGGRRTG